MVASVNDRFGFGAASIGNLYRTVSEDQSRAVLSAAWDGGVRSFDTAPHYGLGLSERRLGAFLNQHQRSSFTVSTKVGRVLEANPDYAGGDDAEHGFAVPGKLRRRFDPSREGILRSLEDSLRRLQLDRVDTLFLHDPDVYDLDEGLRVGLPALRELREQGVVREIGVGVNSAEAAARAVREGDLDVVMIAGRYTLLDQRAADDLLPLCEARDVRVIAAGVFNSGLLAAAEPSTAHYDYGAAPEEVLRRTKRLRVLCGEAGIELPAAAIQFPLRHPAIGSVVIGTARPEAMRANLTHATTTIPEEFWAALVEESLVPPSDTQRRR